MIKITIKGHNREAEWPKDIENELVKHKHHQKRMVISYEKVTKQCRKMSSWKAPGKDGIEGLWIKNLSNLYKRIAVQINTLLMGDESLPAWMTHGLNVVCQKEPGKGNALENYFPIICLPFMWKLLKGVLAEGMHNYLEQEKLFPEEQKGCRRGNCGTKDQLLIDKTMFKDWKKRHTNLSMAWIDYKKAYGFVPHSWINECMKLFEIVDNVRNVLKKSMEQSKL